MPKAPVPTVHLEARGRRLWTELHKLKEFNPAEECLVEEVCRAADRLDQLADDIADGGDYADYAMREARQQQNTFKQMIVSLRIPDAAGTVARREGLRGAYRRVDPAPVTVLDRLRASKTAG